MWQRQSHLWLLLPAAALAALWLAWRCLAAVDFLYPVFYDALDIHAHIEQFAPQNRYKDGFEDTTREERFRLFGAIVAAIHDSGRGLDALAYHDPAGREIDRLLREPEILHLQDVAELIERVTPVGWLALAWTGFHLVLIRALALPVPPLKKLFGISALAFGVVGMVTLVIGPRRLFHVMHELVFPPENPWFFYYQDSLMSTMMKAPDLFGAIAAALVLFGIVLYATLLVAARQLAPRQRA
jgi:hypothetical protein